MPVLGNNRQEDAGVLTSNYVTGKGCQGVCVKEEGREELVGPVWRVKVGGVGEAMVFEVPD